MPGKAYELLFEVALDQYGYITTDNARDLGLSNSHLVDLARRGNLERIGQGLYRFEVVPVTMRDQLMEATLWPRGLGTISHATALDLWDLCDINPVQVHVTIPKRSRIRRRVPAAYKVYERALADRDSTRLEGIPVVTVRRAILDGIESEIGHHLIQQAIDTARQRADLSATERDEILSASRSSSGS